MVREEKDGRVNIFWTWLLAMKIVKKWKSKF